MSTLTKFKALGRMGKNAIAEKVDNIRSVEQEVIADQAEKQERRELLTTLLKVREGLTAMAEVGSDKVSRLNQLLDEVAEQEAAEEAARLAAEKAAAEEDETEDDEDVAAGVSTEELRQLLQVFGETKKQVDA